MLTPFDDFPIHQTPAPIAHPGSGDPNHYDRYFFNGYDRDGDFFFGVAMGLYPNRGVIDAAFSVVRDGVQRSVFASAPAPIDRGETRVGPIAIEVVEPLRVNRVRVDAPELGIEADLTYRAKSIAVEEPRQTSVSGPTVVMDATRLTQLGAWEGAIDVRGERLDLEPPRALGTKDRSWGVRPVGEPTPNMPAAFGGGGTFFIWTPLHFAQECFFLALFERPDGHRWYQNGGHAPLLGADDVVYSTDGFKHVQTVEYELDYRPGTRRSRAVRVTYHFDDGVDETVAFEPLIDFPMKGIGYSHPKWKHGLSHGPDLAVGSDEWVIADENPLAPENVHCEQMCRVRRGDEVGAGVFEQAIFGPHRPTGLREMLDGGR